MLSSKVPFSCFFIIDTQEGKKGKMKGSWNTISLILITTCCLFFFTSNYRDVFAAPTRHLCHPKQRDAILEFKNEFEIHKPCAEGTFKTDSWVNNIDCCSWDGIGCDAKSGVVIELNLSNSCLHGKLNSNSNIFMLQNLRFLDLSNNHFSCQILSSLGNFSNLTTLDLSENHFSGQIPSSLGNLLHLTFLDLTDNNFVGKIPTSLGNLSHLTILLLGANKFVGEIPSSVGNLSDITDLALCENNLAGEIPSSFKNILNLTNLDLSQNNLVGEIPSFFGSFNQLVSLSVEILRYGLDYVI